MKIISFILFLLILVLPVYTEDIGLLKKRLLSSSNENKARILIKLIEEYNDIDISMAEKYSVHAEKLITSIKDTSLKIDIYNGIASVLIYKDDYNESLMYAEKALAIAEKINSKNKIAESLTTCGRALTGLNKVNMALKNYHRALEIIPLKESLLLRGRLQIYLGYIYYNRSDFIRAKTFFINALEVFRPLKNKKYESMALRSLGGACYSKNNYSIALDYYLKALKYYEKSPYKIRLAGLLIDLGNLFGSLGNNKKALEFYLRAKDITANEGYQSINSIIMNNLGTIYQEIGDLDKALKYYFLGLKGEREKKNKLGIAIDLYNIGFLYIEKNQLQDAENYIRESQIISHEIKDRTGIVLSFTALAIIFKQQNKFNKALDLLKIAYKESIGIGSKELIRSVLEEYSYLYTGIRDYRKARVFYQKAEKARKEILNEKSSKKIAEMRTRFETEKKEHEIESLKYDRVLKDLELKKQELQKSVILVGFLIVLVIIILLYRQFRLKISSNRLIRAKNEELGIAYKKLEEVAATDPLTKLSNRRDILQKISYELERFKRYERVFVIIIGDIDDFKAVNDNYGHNAGDSILVSISDIFRESVREQDTVSRWGGEEFLLFLPETALNGGIVLAEKIRKNVEKRKFSYQDKTFSITITLGVSEFREGMDIDLCIKDADQALYKGKEEGKNRVVSYSKQ